MKGKTLVFNQNTRNGKLKTLQNNTLKLVRVRIHEVQMRSSSVVPSQLLLGKSKAFRKRLSTIPKNLRMT